MPTKLTLTLLCASVVLTPACSPGSQTARDVPPLESPTPSPFKPSTPAPPPAPPPAEAVSGGGGALRLEMLAVDKSITYEHLKKNADRYSGQPWAFTGRVQQISESDGRTAALVSLDAWASKLVWVGADFTTEFVERDQVYVFGYLAGNYSYTSVAGWDMTVPAINARAILKPAEAARIRSGKSTPKK